MLRLVLICALAILTASCARGEPPPVRIDSGLLQGVVQGDSVAYKGVPYAVPPVGPLRWRPPQRPASWAGVRPATAFGAVCPQTPGRGLPADSVQSEDCLMLNVWAPLHAVQPAPVMVWLHGGGDTAGTANQPQFDGEVFAHDGIVFVSLDYRIGALGWLAHPALTREAAPGAPLASYGLMDQIAALQWVQRNIRAFGGDPRRVTLAGESAGGESVLFLMATPAAKGLFSQAIVESGAGWYDYPPLAKAEAQGVALVKRAGGTDNADAATLRAMPIQSLVAAGDENIGVIVDGRMVPATVVRAFADGEVAPIPLLIGSNSGEDSLLGGVDPKEALKPYSAAQVAALKAAYGAAAPDDDTLGRLVFRDNWMGAPAHWLAARHSAAAPSYLYQFDYVPGILRERRKSASHGFEMLFVFKALDRAPIPLPALADDEAEMSTVHGCWVSFVKTGKPVCPGGPAWPAYSPAADQLMLFGRTQTSIVAGFNKSPYDVFDRIEAGELAKSNPR